MEKTHGINYRTRRRLITTSIVIKSLLALLLLFCFFYIVANMDLMRIVFGILMSSIDPEYEATIEGINQVFIYFCIFVPIVIIAIFINIAYNLFWGIKSKQVFFRSAKQIVVFQFINCLSFMFMPISGIFMLIASYCKDDGLPTRLSKRKQQKLRLTQEQYKHQKPKLSKNAKLEIKQLKSQKRKGIISQEKFDKLVAKTKKNDAKNIDKK